MGASTTSSWPATGRMLIRTRRLPCRSVSSRASGATCPSSSTRGRCSTPEWNATIVREVVPDDIQRMKQQPGGDMVIGGANLVASFARHGLIDEYRIYVQPVVLGAGHPLFPPSETRLFLRMIDTRRFGNGVVLLKYAST